MYIDLKKILDVYKIKITGVCQVGAHWAEEHKDYMDMGIEHFIYIEPCEEAFNVMKKNFGIKGGNGDHYTIGDDIFSIELFKVACGSENEKDIVMNVSSQNQGQSNSLLQPLGHLWQHPDIVFDKTEIVNVKRLDEIVSDTKFNLLVMDVQGFEGEVLKGATGILPNIEAIYTEVNRGPTYKGNMEIEELDDLLWEHGFVRVETFWPSPNLTWGDSVFIKRSNFN